MKYILRLISLPFLAGYLATRLVFIFIYMLWNHLRYGSEATIYNEKINQTTIQDVFNLIKEQQTK